MVVVTNEDLVCYNALPMWKDTETHDCIFTFTQCISNYMGYIYTQLLHEHQTNPINIYKYILKAA
jgi:hypothetical protein